MGPSKVNGKARLSLDRQGTKRKGTMDAFLSRKKEKREDDSEEGEEKKEVMEEMQAQNVDQKKNGKEVDEDGLVSPSTDIGDESESVVTEGTDAMNMDSAAEEKDEEESLEDQMTRLELADHEALLAIRQIKKDIKRCKQLLRMAREAAGMEVDDVREDREKVKQRAHERRELRRAKKSAKEAAEESNAATLDPSKPVKFHTEQFRPPTWCVPIRADVLTFDFKALSKATQFDVIMMAPPWQLASATPTRGVALGYSQLSDQAIADMPINCLSNSGFIFIWVINNRFEVGLALMQKWGYKFVDSIDWVKQTVNRRLAKSHGFYLQHVKETCIVGVKGQASYQRPDHSDVIYSKRRGQSQKPEEIYHLVESLVPNGKYLEIFARRNNLRDYWVSIGNEL
eukprot:comp19682_c0_seq1/m.23359 comp19682_c0_seq1/g.23359  ORF comp19682_c0_seq1/g.23359 comp19682_c0_seq1/m.23359 type:complete len:398 (-) comp19682_c0_seq1:343-1536(-)